METISGLADGPHVMATDRTAKAIDRRRFIAKKGDKDDVRDASTLVRAHRAHPGTLWLVASEVKVRDGHW